MGRQEEAATVKRYGRWIGYLFIAAVAVAGWWCDVGQFKYHIHSCWCSRDPTTRDPNDLRQQSKADEPMPPSDNDPNEARKLATRKRVAFWQKIAFIAWTAFVIFSAVWYLIRYH